VRVRPTIRSDRAGERNRVVERDAFPPPAPEAPVPEGPTRGEVYHAWLAERLRAGGARMRRTVMEQFRRALVLRRDKDRRLRAVDGPDATFSGELEVTDGDAFAALLARGVGRHAAFGFGMLLLRPPARET
jgi:CRISPR system Cascade subunit CasE